MTYMGTHRLLGTGAVWGAERITLIFKKNETVVALPHVANHWWLLLSPKVLLISV